MIGRIAGRVIYHGEDHVLIDTQGVGYMVYCTDRVRAALPGAGEHAALFTDLLVREDLLQLFGFPTLVEKEWFRLLLSVQGVGAKAALAILGTLGPDGVSRALALGDWGAIKAARGIGPKTAQRVVIELKDKAPAVMAMGVAGPVQDTDVIESIDAPGPGPGPGAGAGASVVSRPRSSAQAEALSALGNLGYAPSEAAGAVAEAGGTAPDAETPELIRLALKLLAPKA
jgi:Holliday junction DNA helicase RuvA